MALLVGLDVSLSPRRRRHRDGSGVVFFSAEDTGKVRCPHQARAVSLDDLTSPDPESWTTP
jgi:hypothetical protein